jgi:hypothetical protein
VIQENVHIENLTIDEFEAKFDALLGTVDAFNQQLLKEIVDILKSRAEQGIVIHEIKEQLGGRYADEDIIAAVDRLTNHSSPLICQVGSVYPRCVLVPYASDWVIDANVANTADNERVRSKIARRSYKNLARKQLIVPNLWTDINGSLTPVLFNSYAEAIVEFILKRPGTTKAAIHRGFSTSFSRKEVHDILEILVKSKVLRELKIIMDDYKKPSVFTKTRYSRCTTKTTGIDAFAQSCYWATDDYYHKIGQ